MYFFVISVHRTRNEQEHIVIVEKHSWEINFFKNKKKNKKQVKNTVMLLSDNTIKIDMVLNNFGS